MISSPGTATPRSLAPPATCAAYSFSPVLLDAHRFAEVELELAIARHLELDSGFEAAVRTAATQLGHQFLFTFPADRFFVACQAAVCMRMHVDNDAGTVFAIRNGADIRFVRPAGDEKTDSYFRFADAYCAVLQHLCQLTTPSIVAAATRQ